MIVLALTASWAMDLDEARQIAVERAVAVEVAAAAVDEARGEAAIALGAHLPAVVGFVDVGTGQGLTSIGFERPVSTQIGAGATVSWAVIDPSAWAAAGAARRSVRGREALLDWARAGARRDATVAWAEALRAEQVAEAWQRAAADAAVATTAVGSQVDAGLRPEADRARARADAATTAATALEAQGAVTSSCAVLQGVLAAEVTGSCALSPSEWGSPIEGSAEHPALVASREALAAARAARRASVLTLSPDVSAQATAAFYAIPGGNSGPGWSASVGLDVPITASGAARGAIRAATARLDAASVAVADQARQLAVARLAAEARWEAARAGLEGRQVAVAAAEQAFVLTDERYRTGLAGLTDLLDARRARDAAAIALAGARAEVGRALAEVEAARGAW